MSLNALALATLLAGEAEAKTPKIPDVSTAELLAQCTATDAVRETLTRAQVEALTPTFDAGFKEALEAPSKRQLARALAQALLQAMQEQVVEDGELAKRMEALAATLKDKVAEMSSVDPNREEIKAAREETNEEQALLDLVFTVEGKPLKMRDLLAKNPQFEKMYQLARVNAFTADFTAKNGLDCTAPARNAVLAGNGNFPDVRTQLAVVEDPKMELKVTVPAWPELEQVSGGAPWRMGLGFEREEFEAGVTELETEQERVVSGTQGLERRYNLDAYTGVVVPVTFTVVEEEKKN